MLLNTSSYSAHSWLVSVSIFLPLFCSTPRVALLVVDLSLSESFPLWFAQHLELICSFTCLDCFNLSCFVLKPRLALLAVHCLWRLSKYSYFRRTVCCKLMFHSRKLLRIRPFSHRFEFGFCLASGGSSNFVTLGKSDDIFRGVRWYCTPEMFWILVSEMAFPAFWEHFKENIKVLNRINFKKHFVQMKTFIKY